MSSINFGDIEGFSLDDLGIENPTIPTPVEVAPVEKVESVDIKMDSGITHTFTSVEPTWDPACEYVSAAEKLAAIDAVLKPMLDRRKEIEAQIKAIKDEMEAKIDALARERFKIDEDTFDLRRQQRIAAQEVRTAMRNLERAMEAQRLSEMYLSKSQTFDEMSVNMPWHDRILPHQMEGAKQIAMSGRMILADSMGLGKSLTSLASADLLQVKRLLIIVPDDVVSNFINEVKHWAPHRNIVTLGKMPKAARHMAVEYLKMLDEYTVIVNYSAWRRDSAFLDKLVTLRFEMAILDEAHTIKETTTNAYKGCKHVILASNSCPECRSPITREHVDEELCDVNGQRIWLSNKDLYKCVNEKCEWSEKNDKINHTSRDSGYLRSIQYLVPMTGTVILNKPTDIFALLSLMQPEVYANKNEFIRQFCFVDWDNKVKFRSGGMDALAKRLAGRYLKRDRKSAGVVLPKQTIQYHDIEMDAEMYPGQARVIQQLSKHAMILLENGKQLPILAMIALITRKRQANVWPAGIQLKDADGHVVFSVGDDVQESIKLDKIITPDGQEGLIPDLTENGNIELGERVVVFSQFKGPLAELQRRCEQHGISVARFDGDTPEDIRREIKMDFDRKFCDQEGYEKRWQVVLCNYKTGGVGLNFTGATQMIILDEEWSPGKANQAYARIDRMGQTEETTIHVLQLERSIDTWMRALNEEKQNMIEGFETANELAGMLLESLKNGEL